MSEIKLEVGKTYRNRKGEEVRIVGFDKRYVWSYHGSDGECYAESGQWGSMENPHDLIEEVTMSDANPKHNEMEVLALEVGKTYRNRKGEEVRIVEKNDKDRHPYQGSNGKVYAENGRWGFLSDKHPEDIIKEIPETRHAFALVAEALTATRYTFDIPEGVKRVAASQEGNRIIVEMVPEAKGPKPGDVCINEKGSVYVFKGVAGDTHKFYVWFGKSGRLGRGWLAMNGLCYPGRPATTEEAQPLWDALKKAGKKWNPETMQVEEITEIDRIREWAEKHYSNHQGIAEAIEAYLKHKEGEK